jgi:hypothetical protein
VQIAPFALRALPPAVELHLFDQAFQIGERLGFRESDFPLGEDLRNRALGTRTTFESSTGWRSNVIIVI